MKNKIDMKQILILSFLSVLCIICSSPKCQGQSRDIVSSLNSKTEIILDSIIHVTKEHSLYKDKVDWIKISDKMKSISIQYDSIESIGKPVEYMFTELGDYHGMLMYNYQIPFRGSIERQRTVKYVSNDSILNIIYRDKMKEPYAVDARFLEDDQIAYFEIVGTGLMSDQQMNLATSEIRNKICELKQKKPKGWIIDLRCNTGGNTHPMMTGIGELIPSKDGKKFNSIWKFENGRFLINGDSNLDMPLKCNTTKDSTKIAVLTSRYTASAGEVVVSSLKGQSNIKIIGEQTAGFSSMNGWHIISDKWILVPAQAYYMSKDKTVHYDGIIPDIEIIEELNPNDLTKGQIFKKAKDWINTGHNNR